MGDGGVRWRAVLGAAVAAVTLTLTGCSPAAEPDVIATAGRFQQLVASKDWSGACELLSESVRTQLVATAARPCGLALPALRLSSGQVGSVQVWGHNAMVTVDDGALFLSWFPSGWRVIAAGCESQGEDLPYQCAVRG